MADDSAEGNNIDQTDSNNVEPQTVPVNETKHNAPNLLWRQWDVFTEDEYIVQADKIHHLRPQILYTVYAN